MIPENNMNAT